LKAEGCGSKMADDGIGREDTAACRNPTHSMIDFGYRRTPEAPFPPDWHRAPCDVLLFRDRDEDTKLLRCPATGVEHAISNTGLADLVFLVIISPVTDDEKP